MGWRNSFFFSIYFPCLRNMQEQQSADPCLSQGRGGAWDTAGVELFFVPNALHFPRATQAIAPSVHRPGATQPQQFLCTSHEPLMPQQSLFLRRSKTQQAAADPVQFQQVPEAVALKRFKAAVCQPSKLPKPFPAAPRRHSGRGRPFLQLQQVPEAVAASFLWTFKAAVCQPSKLPKPFPAAPRRHSGRGRPFLQLQQVPEAVAASFLWTFKAAVCQPSKLPKPFPAAPRRHSGRGRPFLQLQQVPEAVAASFYGRSRLPFASPQNSPNPSLQLPGAHSGRGRPFLQLQQVPEAVAVSF